MQACDCGLPPSTTKVMVPVFDEYGRPTGQYIMMKKSVIDKISEKVGQMPYGVRLH